MTLDYPDDLIFFETVINNFGKKYFNLKDIVNLIDKKPEIGKINLYLEEEWKKNQESKIELKIK